MDQALLAFPEGAGGKTVFENVNVITMKDRKVLENQTVIIEQGIIKKIAPAESLKLPKDMAKIDGKGKYLMPGLMDMHVHMTGSPGHLFLYLANGVTRIRNMAGFKISPKKAAKSKTHQVGDCFALRRDLHEGKIPGPRLHNTSPIWGSDIFHFLFKPTFDLVLRKKKAWKAAGKYFKEGAEYIKVYNSLSPSLFHEFVKCAKEYNTPVVGHVPVRVGLEAAVTGGMQSIEHLTGYFDCHMGFAVTQRVKPEQYEYFAGLQRKHNTWICPTLTVYEAFDFSLSADELDRMPELKYIPALYRKMGRDFFIRFQKRIKRLGKPSFMHFRDDFYKLTAILHKNGVGLLAGTDAGNPYVLPGFSLHKELAELTKGGLTPFEALETATVKNAKYLGLFEKTGTVEETKEADLVLLGANPLEDIKNSTRIEGVMTQGTWLSREEIGRRLDLMEEKYK